MTIDKILVSFFGSVLIIFIYWFFFGKKNDVIASGDKIDIEVSGGYKPSIIKIKKDKTTTLSFLRTDQNSCLEEIVFPDFKIKEYLPLGKKTDIEITPTKTGEFKFHCGMNMFNGKIIIE